MNRRTFLRATAGCAVAASATETTYKAHATSGCIYAETLWLCNLETGKWRQVGWDEWLNGGKP